MRTPEWIMSTPRLVLLLLTVGMIYLAVAGVLDIKDYVASWGLAAGYFFGSRGKEDSNYNRKVNEPTTIQDQTAG